MSQLKAFRIILISFTVLGGLYLGGCRRDGAVVWSKQLCSPDGHWLAMAATKQWSGPGSAYVGTTVYLKWMDQPPVEILGFSNDSAYPAGATGVGMEWVTPKHLDVTYGSHAKLEFQAIMCSGIDITVRNTSGIIP